VSENRRSPYPLATTYRTIGGIGNGSGNVIIAVVVVVGGLVVVVVGGVVVVVVSGGLVVVVSGGLVVVVVSGGLVVVVVDAGGWCLGCVVVDVVVGEPPGGGAADFVVVVVELFVGVVPVTVGMNGKVIVNGEVKMVGVVEDECFLAIVSEATLVGVDVDVEIGGGTRTGSWDNEFVVDVVVPAWCDFPDVPCTPLVVA
jgi:hypothetical protein